MYNSGVEKDGIMYPTFEGWTKIMDVECYKPSGQDNPNITNEDIEYIQNGDEHEVPIEAPNFRYVRILMLETWSGGTYAQIGEMTFWGQPATELLKKSDYEKYNKIYSLWLVSLFDDRLWRYV